MTCRWTGFANRFLQSCPLLITNTSHHINLHDDFWSCKKPIFCHSLPRGVLIYFSVRGRAAEQGIIFRIPTPGQGIVFVKVGSMTGSIFVIFDSKRSF